MKEIKERKRGGRDMRVKSGFTTREISRLLSRGSLDRLDPHRHINIPAVQGGGQKRQSAITQRERAICKQDYSVVSEAVKWPAGGFHQTGLDIPACRL